MVDHIKRWQKLGVHLYIMRGHEQEGKTKIYTEVQGISPSDQIDPRWEELNFLAINLSKTPLVCLDVESTEGSVEDFMEILKRNNISVDSLFYETSLNGGLHIYFKAPTNKAKSSHIGLSKGKIRFDILNTGKAFTEPSNIGNKRCKFGRMNPFSIKGLEEIQDIPEWVQDLF